MSWFVERHIVKVCGGCGKFYDVATDIRGDVCPHCGHSDLPVMDVELGKPVLVRFTGNGKKVYFLMEPTELAGETEGSWYADDSVYRLPQGLRIIKIVGKVLGRDGILTIQEPL